MSTATVVPTANTFSTVVAFVSQAASSTPGTTATIDLTGKRGAWLHCFIGRTATTALTYQAYLAIRRSYNSSSTIRCPQSQYDFISSTAACNKTTLNGAVSAGAATATLTSGTGFSAAGNYCMSSGSSRVEFFTVTGQAANVITIDDSNGFKIAHNSGDACADNADVGSIWLPGGDLWYVTPVNNSGQTVIMGAYADIDVGDTATY